MGERLFAMLTEGLYIFIFQGLAAYHHQQHQQPDCYSLQPGSAEGMIFSIFFFFFF